MMSLTVLNGNSPVSIEYNTTPILQISTSGPTYFWAKIYARENESISKIERERERETREKLWVAYHFRSRIGRSTTEGTTQATFDRKVAQTKVDQLDVEILV